MAYLGVIFFANMGVGVVRIVLTHVFTKENQMHPRTLSGTPKERIEREVSLSQSVPRQHTDQ